MTISCLHQGANEGCCRDIGGRSWKCQWMLKDVERCYRNLGDNWEDVEECYKNLGEQLAYGFVIAFNIQVSSKLFPLK